MRENNFWRVCEALDCERRVELLRHLLEIETSEFPSVSELAERMNTSESSMSVHLKKLAMAGLVSSKRADRRVYYRAFPTTPEGERVIGALRMFFGGNPNEGRIRSFVAYAHALSHARRIAIVRCLHKSPGLSVRELAMHTEMPPQTADRLWGELNKVRIIDLSGIVVPPCVDPETTLLELTLS